MSWSCRLECEVLQKVRYINTLSPTRCYLYFYIAGCKNSIRHSENRFSPYFIIFVLMQFRLWRAAAFVSSPIHVFRLVTNRLKKCCYCIHVADGTETARTDNGICTASFLASPSTRFYPSVPSSHASFPIPHQLQRQIANKPNFRSLSSVMM